MVNESKTDGSKYRTYQIQFGGMMNIVEYCNLTYDNWLVSLDSRKRDIWCTTAYIIYIVLGLLSFSLATITMAAYITNYNYINNYIANLSKYESLVSAFFFLCASFLIFWAAKDIKRNIKEYIEIIEDKEVKIYSGPFSFKKYKEMISERGR